MTFYKTREKSSKDRRAHIVWEEEVESSSFDSCLSSNNECANYFLMARKKGGNSNVYNYDFENEYTYSELFNSFNDMYVYSIKAFKKISLQIETIITLEKEIKNLNRVLDCLKEAHTPLMDEPCIFYDTLAEKIEVAEYFECPILKLELELLKDN